eukprot:gb/GFBE01079791.1/.p1 GENE.gb/GFBE01079791.1/~~gb/GFBE01079791.1/.p1  ORF type:complete len:176 (+),score=34.40 gb/GFBE01079791.1/:1-528(+)
MRQSSTSTAMLYELGGYYFDNDVDVMLDVRMLDFHGASFVSVINAGMEEFGQKPSPKTRVHQAFIATVPRHPVSMMSLEEHLKAYEAGQHPFGPEMVGRALLRWLNAAELQQGLMTSHFAGSERRAYLYQETRYLEKHNLPDRTDPSKCCCNFHFEDDAAAIAWAHAPGTSGKEC